MPNTFTITGNVTGDPELRFVGNNSAAVVSFTIADTPRKLDKATGEWSDGETLFMRCNLWREAAENVAESLRKGTRVVATGTMIQRDWEKNGEKRVSYELDVTEIGPSLKYATATVVKKPFKGGSAAPAPASAAVSAPADPWGVNDPQPPF